MKHAEDSGIPPNQSASRCVAAPQFRASKRLVNYQPVRRFHHGRSRIGAAIVEFAVLLPVVLVIVFGTIEAASMIFLKQALVQASYESAKVIARREGTEAAAIRAANEVAGGRRIENLDIQFEPSDVQSLPQGSSIRVTVSAPSNANTITGFTLLGDRKVAAFAVMVKE